MPSGEATKDVRCTDVHCQKVGCGVLLGKVQGDWFEVKRGGIQVSFTGHGHVHVICYKCGNMTHLWLPIDSGAPEGPSKQAPTSYKEGTGEAQM